MNISNRWRKNIDLPKSPPATPSMIKPRRSLFNLARGTRSVRSGRHPHERDKIIRPLLRLEKAELLAWLKAEKIGYVKDKSNRSLKYARNRIRHKVIPELEQINAAASAKYRRMSEIVNEELEFLESLTVSAYKKR